MNNTYRFTILLFVMLTLAGCGRKKKDIFSFSSPLTRKVKRLSLPSIRGGAVEYCGNSIKVSWLPIELNGIEPNLTLLGYHVYRMTPGGFIPKERFLQHKISQNYFIIPDSDTSRTYGVRGLFLYYDQKITGPLTIVSACMGK